MDVIAGRSGDHGALGAQQPGLGMAQGQAEGLRPGPGDKAVAIALAPAVGRDGVGGVLLQDLGLATLVLDLGQQPELIPVGARVLFQRQEMPAHQAGLVARTLGLNGVPSQALQAPAAQALAGSAIGEAAGKAIVFQRGLGRGFRIAVQAQPRLQWVVIA